MYNMTTPKEMLIQAEKWWRNLSNNQMREMQRKHFPNYTFIHAYMIHEMWTNEGEPEPQTLIPVTVFA